MSRTESRKTARSYTSGENRAAGGTTRWTSCETIGLGEEDCRAGDEGQWGYEGGEYARTGEEAVMSGKRTMVESGSRTEAGTAENRAEAEAEAPEEDKHSCGFNDQESWLEKRRLPLETQVRSRSASMEGWTLPW